MSRLSKDAYISKLKKLNEKLRNKLKDLNSRLERVLDRINTKQLLAKKKNKEVPVEKQISVCDKEIENAQKQLENYKKEILRLTSKVDELSQVNKVIDLEEEIKLKTEIKSGLKKEIKQLERNIHDQGKELEKLANADDHHVVLNSLTEKLRVWKEKSNKLETTIEREKKAMEDHSERVQKLKQEKSQLEKDVEKLMKEKGFKEPEKASNKKIEIQKLKEEQEKMIKKNKLEESKNRKEERDMDRKLEKLESELEELQKQLREKEQENRISTMKIRQYKRTIKQAKLKPMQMEESKETDKEKSKDRSKSKPKAGLNKSIVQDKKPVPVKKHTTKRETTADMKRDLNDSKDNQQLVQKPLGDVKAPTKDGKGTFETEVHL